MLRVPRRVLPLETEKQYCAGSFATARAKGESIVLSFCSEDEEEGGEWIEEEHDRLAAFHLRAELLRRFHAWRASAEPAARPRTGGELLEAAEARAEARRREEAELAARQKASREREAAAARERHLAALARREGEAWRELDALLASKLARKYDEAIVLLRDLRDVCTLAGRAAEAAERIARLRDQHAKKPSLVERLRKAGLVTLPAQGELDSSTVPTRRRAR